MINGINVAIEKDIVQQVADLTLDYQESENEAGLVMLGGGQDCC
nr:hypothetical protein [Halalkalibacter okhensis]